MIQSPLNYIGGKYKLLPQLLPFFPQKISTFVDLFCGGCNVGINVAAEKFIYNDINEPLVCLCGTFKNLDKEIVFEWIYQIIEKYGLSLVSEYGYAHYGCESGAGLGKYNRSRFNRLRDDFNSVVVPDYYYYIMLYVIIVYAFNNQIRFNSNGKYNLPVGKRDFNRRMEKKLAAFIDVLHSQECVFSCKDFRSVDVAVLDADDFVYVDPPYLITCATYNEQNGWHDDDEKDLLKFLDGLSEKNIRFALSNVLRSKGKENKILLEWLDKNNGRYKTNRLNFNYANSNYHTKDKTANTEEVLITNY